MDEKFIAYRLDELKEGQKAMSSHFAEYQKEIYNKLEHLEKEVTNLQTKSTIWGAIAGTLATGIIYVITRILGSRF